MPAYDYECTDCHHTFEVSHKIGEPGPKSCPKCKRKKVEKVFLTAPAFHTYYSPLHPRRNRGRGH